MISRLTRLVAFTFPSVEWETKQNKTKEFVIGVAMLGHIFHNNPIPAKYAKVFV
jgi:hypothetical protein